MATHPKIAIFIGSCDFDCEKDNIACGSTNACTDRCSTPIWDGRLRAKVDQVYKTVVLNPAYNAIYQYHHGKPLLAIFVGTPSPFGATLPAWTDDRFTVRWMTGWIDSQPTDASGRSDYWSFKDRLGPASPTYNLDPFNGFSNLPDHVAVVSAFPGQTEWGEVGGLNRNGLLSCSDQTSGTPGIVFKQQWTRAMDVDPEIVTIATWNEWLTNGLGTSDQYTPACSSDIEPSVAFGNFYLDLMKQSIAAFRGYRSDLILRDSNNGNFAFKNNPSFYFEKQYQWPGNSGANYVPFACDMNADGYGDLGLWDRNIGTFYWRLGPTFATQQQYAWPSTAGAAFQPLAGDFNDDLKCDLAARDVATGMFYWRLSPNYTTEGQYQWASGANYQSFVGDFNGDSKVDIGLRDTNAGAQGGFFIGASAQPSVCSSTISGCPGRIIRRSPAISTPTVSGTSGSETRTMGSST